MSIVAPMSQSMIKQETPEALGYRMPAEWSRHRATWLSWPHNRETWPSQLEQVRDVWVTMIENLSRHEEVCLLVNDEQTRQNLARRLKNAVLENIKVLQIPTVDVWMRDYGPTFVTRDLPESPLAFNDWIFNGWGGKYPAYEGDDQVAKKLASLLRVPVFHHSVVLEGGSIDVNGAGMCLTTEQCLLNKNRNPHMSRREIEEFLKSSLGVNQIIWLGKGIVGDDTDGHIDDIARFVGPTTVVCIEETHSKDESYPICRENVERLQQVRGPNGSRLSIVPLPCPAPVYYEGARLPASYANFYIANEIVLVPMFDDPCDAKAVGTLQELFPDRKVIGLPCTAVVAGLGAIHCVTQQEPFVGGLTIC